MHWKEEIFLFQNHIYMYYWYYGDLSYRRLKVATLSSIPRWSVFAKSSCRGKRGELAHKTLGFTWPLRMDPGK